MREVALFVEDSAHRQVIGALVQRLADERGVAVRLDWRSAVRGHGRVAPELGGIEFADDIVQQMEIEGPAWADPSFRRFVDELRHIFRHWGDRTSQ